MILINYAITEADLLAIDIPTALQLNVYSGCCVESQLNQLLLMNFSIDNIWRITVFFKKKDTRLQHIYFLVRRLY